MSIKLQLQEYYSKASKHSNYQVLPELLEPILGNLKLETKTRYERERMEYIRKNLTLKGSKVIDIGGNTGFFTFEAIGAGAGSVTYYDGNKDHARFVELAADALGLKEKVIVKDEYYNFLSKSETKYDVCFLLNVLHHLGDDFGDKSIDVDNAKKTMVEGLNHMSTFVKKMVFQLGYNWKGDIKCPLFTGGTKNEVINFVEHSIKGSWEIKKIGIAEKINEMIVYKDLGPKNEARDDSLGEFLNRPIFILESRNYEG